MSHVKNPDQYFDRTVQEWHYYAFPKDYDAIDLDLMGVCHTCRRPLYLIESTTNPGKYYTILRTLAELSQTHAFVVYHREGAITGAKLIYPQTATITSAEQLAECIHWIRRTHAANGCGTAAAS